MLIKVRNIDAVAHHPDQEIIRLLGQPVSLIKGNRGDNEVLIEHKGGEFLIPSEYLEWPYVLPEAENLERCCHSQTPNHTYH